MSKVFADTFYWVSLINLRDQWRNESLTVSQKLAGRFLVTTDEVLTETLNYFAKSGEFLRGRAVENTRAILLNQHVEIISCSHNRILDAITLYENRLDKKYSLTDCVSMLVMKEIGITDVLTHDDHFRQEGFNVLL